MKKDQKKAKLFTEMSFKWRDFRLQEDTKEVNEVIDKRAISYLTEAIVLTLIGNKKAGISKLSGNATDKIIRKYVDESNFDETHKKLYEEINKALQRFMLTVDK